MKECKKEALAEFHRKHILEASEQLFTEKGFTKTTMDDIAKTAGYSKATLYVYFKNKEEIINHLTLESMRKLHQHIHEALTTSSNLFTSYKAICYELVKFQKETPLYFDIALSNINVDIENPNTPQSIKGTYDVGEKIDEEIAKMLLQGIKEGFIEETLPILPTIFWFWGSITGIIKVASQKTDFIRKAMSLEYEEFIDYSFKRLLQSILKEGVQNGY